MTEAQLRKQQIMEQRAQAKAQQEQLEKIADLFLS